MLHDLWFRMRALFRRRAREHDLNDELEFHLHNETAQYIRSGLTPQEAARRARIEFGGIEQIKEETRESQGVDLMESTLRDVWYAARVLRKSPAFTGVAVLSLALGIGANAAIFELINAIRLRALPVQAPGELAEIHVADMSGARGSKVRNNAVTYRIWEQVRDRQAGFAGVAAWSDDELNLSPAGEVREVRGLWVSGEFFSVLGVQPALGRLFTPADDRRGCGAPGAVVSHSFWRSELAGDPAVIGRKVSINGHAVPILGVTPASFFGVDAGHTFQIALPVCSITAVRGYDALNAGTFWWLGLIGRMKPGWTAARAAAQLEAVSPAIFQSSLPANYPHEGIENYLAMKLTAKPAPGGVSDLGERYSDPLWILLGIAGLVLLIACFNLANLLLARASAREREIAMRLAIGASRGRLIRQLLAESLLIAGAGATLGLGLSYTLSRLLVALLDSPNDSVFLDLRTDWRVLAFAGALAILTCLVFGLAPALRATRGTLNDVFKGSGRGMTSTRERLGLRRALVVSQVALSVVLLVGSLLFAGSFRKLLEVETGFHKERVLIADLRFARSHPAAVPIATYQKRLLQRIGAVPGVLSVADTTVVPISGMAWSNHSWMEDQKPSTPGESYFSHISPRYFHTFGTALLAGRDFTDRDNASSPKVAIVNLEFARQVAKSDHPVGRHFFVEATPSTPTTEYEIVGLAANTKYLQLREPFQAVVFLPMAQDPAPSLQDQIVIRTAAAPATLYASIRRAIAEVDPDAHFALLNFNEMMYDSLSRERLMATLSTGFGVLAGLLAAFGLYGMISYMVAQRRNEIGVRMALGADRRSILAMVLGDSGRLLAAGLAMGIPLSIAAAALARTLLYGLKPYDAVILLTAAALLTLVALIATWVPARRAAMLDPLSALREE